MKPEAMAELFAATIVNKDHKSMTKQDALKFLKKQRGSAIREILHHIGIAHRGTETGND